MAVITVDQQMRLLRAVFQAMLGDDGMAHRPAGDIPLEKELELVILDQIDLQSPRAVSEMIARMVGAHTEFFTAELPDAYSLTPGDGSVH